MPVPTFAPVKATIICGIDIREDAKITGITPAVLTFSGINVDLTAHHLPSLHLLGILYRDLSCGIIEHDNKHDRHQNDCNNNQSCQERLCAMSLAFYEHLKQIR